MPGNAPVISGKAMKRGSNRRVEPKAVIGVAWFVREEWLKLAAVVPDRSELDDTFEEWEKNAQRALRMLEAEGHKVQKVTITIDALMVPGAQSVARWRVPGGVRQPVAAQRSQGWHFELAQVELSQR
jgi:hypothetical protein